jgi:TatD DNase family protein
VRALTDSHAHLSLVAAELGAEALEELFAAYALAWEGGSDGASPLLVDIGVEPADFQARFGLTGERPFLRHALGVWPGHPWVDDVPAALAGLEKSLEAAGPRASAIGECGLDYHYEEESAAAQRALFEGQIGMAARRGLPLVVHSREAFADTLAILRSAGKLPRTVIHCFGYGAAEAEAFLALGCAISFAGNVTFRKSEGLNAALRLVPEERLLLETDSPYMNPMPRRGKPSSSADIERTYDYAAAARGVDAERLARTVSRNARDIFG